MRCSSSPATLTRPPALKKVEKYFGDIPPGPPVARYKTWIPKIPGTRREVVADRVPQPALYKVWNIPPYGDADTFTWVY